LRDDRQRETRDAAHTVLVLADLKTTEFGRDEKLTGAAQGTDTLLQGERRDASQRCHRSIDEERRYETQLGHRLPRDIHDGLAVARSERTVGSESIQLIETGCLTHQ
jgi:hypothetical protein